jgi:hypothetical protein
MWTLVYMCNSELYSVVTVSKSPINPVVISASVYNYSNRVTVLHKGVSDFRNLKSDTVRTSPPAVGDIKWHRHVEHRAKIINTYKIYMETL